jgi:transcriptional regulator with XRE-family HTH domain
LAAEADVDLSYITRIEDGRARPSIDVYARLSRALGADLAAHLYPNTGPTIRDRHQTRIVEKLLTIRHSRWKAHVEIAVHRPARGWIDLVLHDPTARLVVAVEVQSDISRLEQLIRWGAEKARSLPSWEHFDRLGPVDTVSQWLVVRSTRATHGIGDEFVGQLAAAFPAHPDDALLALETEAQWPGSALVWADVRPDAVRLVARRRRAAPRHGTMAGT